MIEIVMEVDDEFWDIINQLKEFKGQKEIIHCEDCKYWDVDNDVGFCVRTEDCDWNADDFCSKGEKK